MSASNHERSPSVDDFFTHSGGGGGSRIKPFLRALVENVPTLVPAGLSQAVSNSSIRGSIGATARRLNIPVRMIVRGDDIWVLRLPKDNERRGSQ